MSLQFSSHEGQTAVFLGDSITFGYGLQEGEHPYSELVSRALGFHSYENHGISGSRVADEGFEPMCDRIGLMNDEAVPEDLPNTITGRIYSEYAAAIREVASLYSIPVCDQWNIAGIQPLLPDHNDLYFTGDNGVPGGLHPNQAGHERLASRILSLLKSL